jgi:hypothetical protein
MSDCTERGEGRGRMPGLSGISDCTGCSEGRERMRMAGSA